MKNIYVLLLLAAGFADAQIVNIPDANLKAKLVSENCVNVSETGQGGTDADTNNDGEIQLSEALAVTDLYVPPSGVVNDVTGLEAFVNITKLRITGGGSSITSLDFSGFPQLIYLQCSLFNILSNLNLSGLTNLELLDCSFESLPSLDLSDLVNLKTLYCNANPITNLDLSGNPNLIWVSCQSNAITSLNVTMLPNLMHLDTKDCPITNLSVAGLANLEYLNFENNQLSSIDLSGLVGLKYLYCNSNQLSALSLSGLNQLVEIQCAENQIANLDVSNRSALKVLSCSQNQMTSLNVVNLPSLETLICYENQLSALDVNASTSLTYLSFYTNNIATINLSALTNLVQLWAFSNPLTALDVSTLTNLELLSCGNTLIQTLALENLSQLTTLGCAGSQLTSLDITGCTTLQGIDCSNNLLTSIDFTASPSLHLVFCSDNLFTSLDFSSLTQLDFTLQQPLGFFNNPNLEYVNLKGIPVEYIVTADPFLGCTNLAFACISDAYLTGYQPGLALHPDIVANSYCSFTPGGNYNTISGTATFDSDNNGCSGSDPKIAYFKLNLNGVNSGSAFTNSSGAYTFYTDTGNFTLTPAFENPYFNISPSAPVAINFTALQQEQTHNFCVSPNGFHPDLEVVLVPLGAVRPGFDANYEIVYRNKGNQLQSGQINLSYDDVLTDFVSASPATSNQLSGLLTWNFSDLMPFEVRTIHFILNVNSPVENPPVNAGDLFTSTAQITNSEGEETPLDNTFTLDQIAVNSFDPNDKTCLEGTNVLPENIGKYLHYNINFENTGTADAINIVVKDTIDTTRFDINTLQLLYASHPVNTKITGNVVEFIFENINLPPSIMNPIGGHGNVLFKIKTLSTLTLGDEVSNTANIYFDYNAPIDTNEARTAFNNLSKSDFVKDNSVTVYPNPAKNKVTVKATGTIKSVQLYDVQGRILQTIIEDKNQVTIDLSMQLTGIYFVTVTTLQGSSTQKIIKQ